MRSRDLLAAWDLASTVDRQMRPLALAASLAGAGSMREAADWPIGARDRALLVAHAPLLGGSLDLVASCPACGEAVSFAIELDLVLQAATAPDWPLRIPHAGIWLRIRRPTGSDLQVACAESATPASARRILAERCVRLEGAAPGTTLDESMIEAAASILGEADPLADCRFDLRCPSCASAWQALLDPPRICWRALDLWARRELDVVAELARGYGWSERDILAMPDARRRHYLAARA